MDQSIPVFCLYLMGFHPLLFAQRPLIVNGNIKAYHKREQKVYISTVNGNMVAFPWEGYHDHSEGLYGHFGIKAPGLNIRAIVRKLGIPRKTMKKYLEG
ncbi:MAG: hypothetical protein JXO49_03380 [Deltaproteobacteria bacterium]|nr:hypothetical protein [Candidatus Anaeroferrophillus wilburensis]MBN2888371.1 hypothetical protein [Deltaproteobacteria bacterium]